MTAKFFKNPFAEGGDKTPIPNASDPSGVVTYVQGFGERYQLQLGVSPDALPFPRLQFNALINDITGALNQYQTKGVPDFISTSDNGGTAYSYGLNSLVLYSGSIYQSISSSNTSLPTDTTKWRLIDNNAAAIIYPNVDFDGAVADGNIVYWNSGSNQFNKALANGADAQNVIGIADVTNNRIIAFGKCGLMSGLIAGKTYYLSDSVAGTVTNIPPVNNIVRIGVAETTSSLFININLNTISNFQIFTSSGTFTVPNNVYKIFVKMKGGGGGGGASTTTENGTGGAGGGYTEGYLSVTPGDSLPVVVGAGGAAGTPGVSGGIGGDGGTSSLSSFSATGGGGGPVSDGAGYGSGPGIGSGGTLNLKGQVGGLAGITSVRYDGGTGGLSGGYVAGSGAGAIGSLGQDAPSNSGGGGGGAGYLSGAVTGGAGGSGIVEIYW